MADRSIWGVTRAQRLTAEVKLTPEARDALAAKRRRQKLPKRSRSANGTRKPRDASAAWEAHIRRTYGLTADAYQSMYDRQHGACAICGRPERARGGRSGTTALRLAVDHDHKTGKVRGLLCGGCNTAIGALEHDPHLLEQALRYLGEWPCESEWSLPK